MRMTPQLVGPGGFEPPTARLSAGPYYLAGYKEHLFYGDKWDV